MDLTYETIGTVLDCWELLKQSHEDYEEVAGAMLFKR